MDAEGLKLLTTEEVAGILGRNPRTILKAAHDGQLACVRLGHRTVRFRPDQIAEYIAAHEIRRVGGEP